MRTKNKAKCSFYKACRKKGLNDEEIKRLWLEKKVKEEEEKQKAKEEADALAKLQAELETEPKKELGA